MFGSLYPLPYLPSFSGPYKVGSSEVEVPISELLDAVQTGDAIETIKFRIFYPTVANAKPTSSVYWLPEPQKQLTEAYASFMGATSGWTSFMATSALSMLKYVKLPVLKDASILSTSSTNGHPVCIFSHGLGGTMNSYSSIVGNLASCGVVCFVPEHRDGSAPIAVVRNERGENARSIPYRKTSHDPSPTVLNARNAQLRTRLWELENVYSIIRMINDNQAFSNFATVTNAADHQNWLELKSGLSGKLNLRPGQVTFVGHSFGAATITQFVKSVFYHQHIPERIPEQSLRKSEWDWEPLSRHETDSPIVKQITADTPVALLDLWTMPLRGEPTKWLFEKPMPCYHKQPKRTANLTPSTIAIMSAEFYKWTDLLNRTRSVLSAQPHRAHAAFEASKVANQPKLPDNDKTRSVNPIPELSKQRAESMDAEQHEHSSTSTSRTQSPAPVPDSVSDTSIKSASSSSTTLDKVDETTDLPKTPIEPHLYLVTQSAHLSQSDFGVLFPNLTKYAMKAIEPEKTLELNLRAIMAMMKSQGLEIKSFQNHEEDKILVEQVKTEIRREERWVRVPLTGATESI